MARLLHVVLEGLGSFAAYPRAAWLELDVLSARDFAAASKPVGKASRYEAWFFNTIFAKRHAMGRFVVPSSSLRACDVVLVAAVQKSTDENRQILDQRGVNLVDDRLFDGAP